MTIWTTCTDGARQDRIALHRLAEVNAEDWTWAALPVSCEDGPLQRTMVAVCRPQGCFAVCEWLQFCVPGESAASFQRDPAGEKV